MKIVQLHMLTLAVTAGMFSTQLAAHHSFAAEFDIAGRLLWKASSPKSNGITRIRGYTWTLQTHRATW